MSASDRTEKPSERRLRDARKKGQVARSRDAGQVAALGAALVAFAYFGRRMFELSAEGLATGLRAMGRAPEDLAASDVVTLARSSAIEFAQVTGPLAVGAVLAIVLAQGFQSGWVFAGEALALKWDRLSPARGLKRLGFSQGWTDAAKAIVVVTGLGVLTWQASAVLVADSIRLMRVAPPAAAAAAWGAIEQLLRQSALLLALVALGDYGIQRWRHMQSLRMTKNEVREEARLTEGSPEAKSRVRRIQREMSRRRMMRDVPRATVVITNPTHFAVALEYRRQSMAAPVVIAKGRNLVAQRIKDIAQEHGIPIVENVTLARALYRDAEIGDVIPGDLFDAVAEVLAYLIRLRRLTL